MIPPLDLKAGIIHCMNYGKRMTDDAHLLWQSGCHASAIPLYILAYEELNKAAFLEENYRAKASVSEKELSQLTKGGAHSEKLQYACRSLIKQIREMPESKRWAVINYQKSQDPSWQEGDRNHALEGLEFLAGQLPKLNDVKKSFLYVDYNSIDGWKIATYGPKVLDAFCSFLHRRSIFQYSLLKMIIDLDNAGLYPHDLKTIDEKNRMHNHEAMKEFEKALESFQLPKSKTADKLVLQVLRGIELPVKKQLVANK